MILELLKNLGITLGLSAIIATVFVWIARKFIEQMFSKDLEKFKLELEKESVQFKIKYEKLHLERAEVIKDVYKKIVKTYRSFNSLINPLQLAGELQEAEKRKIAADEINKLIDNYEENRIFFEEVVAKEIDNLIKEFIKTWRQFEFSRMLRDQREPNADEWNKAWEQIDKEIPIIKTMIEERFRKIIGVE